MKRLLCMILTGFLLVPSAGCYSAPHAEEEGPSAGTLQPIDLPSQWPEEPIVINDPQPTDAPEDAEPTGEADAQLPEIGG